MSTPHIRGVTGLLNGILSPARPLVPDCSDAQRPRMNPSATVPMQRSTPQLPVRVRRGRPPGKLLATASKEKVTVWISSALIADYREWTWEARCQLSQLVERALTDYRKSHSASRQ